MTSRPLNRMKTSSPAPLGDQGHSGNSQAPHGGAQMQQPSCGHGWIVPLQDVPRHFAGSTPARRWALLRRTEISASRHRHRQQDYLG